MSEPIIGPHGGARRIRGGATLVVVGAFVMGMIAGAALLHIARLSLAPSRGADDFGPPPPGGPRGPGFRPEPPVEHLTRVLGLSPDQTTRLRAVLDDGRTRMKREADATRDRIREILTADQKAKFDTMRPPPPPPPPGFPPPPPGGPPPPPPEGEGPGGPP